MDAVALAFPILVGLIVVALAFDFLNGLHDAANSIATVVSTRVMRPQHAVLWAAFFNFVAFLIFGSHVAQTVGTGIVAANVVDAHVVFGALMGAIIWNVITWGLGIPSSSSHALIGGLVGAGTAKAGIKVIVWDGLVKTTAAIVLSPLCGFVLAMLLFLIVTWMFVRYTPFAVDRTFRRLQFVSASLYSLGHGGNDAQKTMGIIAVLLVLARLSRRRVSRAVLGHVCLLRRDGRRHPDRRLAHRAHDGIARSRGCGRFRVFAPRPAAPSRCSPPPISAFRFRPRTPSPAASSASARRAGCRRCAGASPTTSSSPGS